MGKVGVTLWLRLFPRNDVGPFPTYWDWPLPAYLLFDFSKNLFSSILFNAFKLQKNALRIQTGIFEQFFPVFEIQIFGFENNIMLYLSIGSDK